MWSRVCAVRETLLRLSAQRHHIIFCTLVKHFWAFWLFWLFWHLYQAGGVAKLKGNIIIEHLRYFWIIPLPLRFHPVEPKWFSSPQNRIKEEEHLFTKRKESQSIPDPHSLPHPLYWIWLVHSCSLEILRGKISVVNWCVCVYVGCQWGCRTDNKRQIKWKMKEESRTYKRQVFLANRVFFSWVTPTNFVCFVVFRVVRSKLLFSWTECTFVILQFPSKRRSWKGQDLINQKAFCGLSEPITSFEAKKWIGVNFPCLGKVKNFPSCRKSSFSPNPSFPGKAVHSKERESYFQGKMIPQRENFPSEGKSTQFSLRGKVLPRKMFRESKMHWFEKLRLFFYYSIRCLGNPFAAPRIPMVFVIAVIQHSTLLFVALSELSSSFSWLLKFSWRPPRCKPWVGQSIP